MLIPEINQLSLSLSHIHTFSYYTAIKKNKLLLHKTMWVNCTNNEKGVVSILIPHFAHWVFIGATL